MYIFICIGLSSSKTEEIVLFLDFGKKEDKKNQIYVENIEE